MYNDTDLVKEKHLALAVVWDLLSDSVVYLLVIPYIHLFSLQRNVYSEENAVKHWIAGIVFLLHSLLC